MAGSRKTSKSLIYAKPPSKGELMRISASSTRRVCFRARTWLDQDQLFGSDDCAGLCSGAERGERVLGAIVMTMCPKLSSQSTLRWREMDSNSRSPVRQRFSRLLFPQHAHAPPPPSKNARRPVQQLLLPVVDPVRMNAELTRQLGDRPVPPTAAAATPSL